MLLRNGHDVTQIQIRHCGVYQFKGLSQPQPLMQINSAALAGRAFPAGAASKKAKQLGPALGPQCSVLLPAHIFHASNPL